MLVIKAESKAFAIISVRRMSSSTQHLDVLRTPDSQFEDLPDYPFEPRYFESAKFHSDLGPLRFHYLDEGPQDAAETVLMLHGQPSWSFLYRHMIPVLVAKGHRCVAPDLIGFGRSDKPTNDSVYTFKQHLEWLDEVLKGITPKLSNTTVVLQDWGGILGLRLLAEDIERNEGLFSRAVVANTTLSTADAPGAFPQTGTISDAFYAWKGFVHKKKLAGPKTIGDLLGRSTGSVSEMITVVKRAYDCPFPSDDYKAGVRRFPELVPTPADDPTGRPQSEQAAENVAAWKILSSATLPMLCAFSDEDPILGQCYKLFQEYCIGTKGQEHVTIGPGVGHFLQDKGGKQLAEVTAKFIESNPRG